MDIPDILKITDIIALLCSYLDIRSIISLHAYTKKEINYTVLMDIENKTNWNLYECSYNCKNVSEIGCADCRSNFCILHIHKCLICKNNSCIKCSRKCRHCETRICDTCTKDNNDVMCTLCMRVYCAGLTKCTSCKKGTCDKCLYECSCCQKLYCDRCTFRCNECSKILCNLPSCREECTDCKRSICIKCKELNNNCTYCHGALCRQCITNNTKLIQGPIKLNSCSRCVKLKRNYMI
jgi:hypothetical protein